jgi:hypothetical protein
MTDADHPTDTDELADDADADADINDGADVRNALSGLQKAHAPATFAQDVTATIHKRSAGRFFGRRTFGDRVPFGALLVVALVGLAVIAWVLSRSSTGSLRGEPDRDGSAGSANGALLQRP